MRLAAARVLRSIGGFLEAGGNTLTAFIAAEDDSRLTTEAGDPLVTE